MEFPQDDLFPGPSLPPEAPPARPAAPLTILRAAEAIGAACDKIGAPDAIRARVLGYGGELLARGWALDEVMRVVRSELEALCPEQAPEMEG